MSAFQLKILAIILMVIDHTGFLISGNPELAWLSVVMRIIGRLSFPIFAWLIATGCRNTRNINKYLLRLFIFAFISQVPFSLFQSMQAFNPYLNIFFTLSAGVLAIIFYERSGSKLMGYGFIFMLSAVAWLLNFDYSFYGIWVIALLYIHYDNLKRAALLMLIPTAVLLALTYADYYAKVSGIVVFGTELVLNLIQPLAMFAFILIAKYNGEQGSKRLKYFFYAFYPLHLMLLWGMRLLIA
jgi:hypothetical protein